MDKDIITKRAFSIVIISFLLSTFVSLWSLREMTQHNGREICRVLAARINDAIAGEISEPLIVAKTMANDRFLAEMMEGEEAIENEKIDLPLRLESGSDYVFHRLGGSKFAVTKYLENLNWYLVVQGDGSDANTRYYSVIFLNVGLCLLVMALMLAASRIIVMRTNLLTKASFRDHSTMLLNRRAYEEEKLSLLDTGLKEDFVYVTADINGLKTANDTLGHAAGDELIRGAAGCLEKSFGAYGKVYRIGGDEFALLPST